ncbi:MAG: HlyC/CorC family transporter [Alphaproteobacteria bacterium]|nr:MAG: HlyC/CorC family transporter [Alphaproteobacteria bacterium]
MANITSTNGKNIPNQKRGLNLLALVDRLRSYLKKRNGDSSLRESLEDILEEDGSTAQELRNEERVMLLNVLNLEELRVEDVMVPRADIKAINADMTVAECARIFGEVAHSRLPVYQEVLDNPIGMAHIKDVVGLLVPPTTPDGKTQKDGDDPAKVSIAKFLKPVLFVPPSMPVVDLFLKMQATHIHMALVIDEFGGTDGLVTIEDLVEEIVGEIEDEHDTATTPNLKLRNDGSYDASARVPIDTLEAALSVDLLDEKWEEEIETLGGLVFFLVGRVPQRGELIRHPAGIDFQVVDADPRRIKRLRIYPGKKRPTAAQDPSSDKTSELKS